MNLYAANSQWSTRPEESGSGVAPPTVSTSLERNRVSCAKNPLVFAPMSPRSSEMQNVDPSRIVSTSYSPWRTIRAPLDCWSALITISSTLTWSGRVSAKSTQSAISSGVTGSSPS